MSFIEQNYEYFPESLVIRVLGIEWLSVKLEKPINDISKEAKNRSLDKDYDELEYIDKKTQDITRTSLRDIISYAEKNVDERDKLYKLIRGMDASWGANILLYLIITGKEGLRIMEYKNLILLEKEYFVKLGKEIGKISKKYPITTTYMIHGSIDGFETKSYLSIDIDVLVGFSMSEPKGFSVQKEVESFNKGVSKPLDITTLLIEQEIYDYLEIGKQIEKGTTILEYIKEGKGTGGSAPGIKIDDSRISKNLVPEIENLKELESRIFDESPLINTVLMKPELGKNRVAFSADLNSFYQLDYSIPSRTDYIKKNEDTSLGESITKRTRRIASIFIQMENQILLPADYYHFDMQVKKQTEERIYEHINEEGTNSEEIEILGRFINRLKRSILRIPSSLTKTKKKDELIKQNNGLCSGLRTTSLIGLLWNAGSSRLVRKIVEALLHRTVGKYALRQGDDLIMANDGIISSVLYLLVAKILDIVFAIGKTYYDEIDTSFRKCEFLRQTFELSSGIPKVKSILCRGLVKCTQRNPVSLVPTSILDNVKSLIQTYYATSRRNAKLLVPILHYMLSMWRAGNTNMLILSATSKIDGGLGEIDPKHILIKYVINIPDSTTTFWKYKLPWYRSQRKKMQMEEVTGVKGNINYFTDEVENGIENMKLRANKRNEDMVNIEHIEAKTSSEMDIEYTPTPIYDIRNVDIYNIGGIELQINIELKAKIGRLEPEDLEKIRWIRRFGRENVRSKILECIGDKSKVSLLRYSNKLGWKLALDILTEKIGIPAFVANEVSKEAYGFISKLINLDVQTKLLGTTKTMKKYFNKSREVSLMYERISTEYIKNYNLSPLYRTFSET